MNLKKSFAILCCLSAAACATDAPAPAPAPAPAQATPGAQPSGAARNAPAPGASRQNPPPLDTTQNVVVPDNAQVTITKKQDLTVEEYRVGGRLYMIKITPKHGKPYYMIDERGDGRFARRGSGHFMVNPPMWVIKKF